MDVPQVVEELKEKAKVAALWILLPTEESG
jgi:hypothetical protein